MAILNHQKTTLKKEIKILVKTISGEISSCKQDDTKGTLLSKTVKCYNQLK